MLKKILGKFRALYALAFGSKKLKYFNPDMPVITDEESSKIITELLQGNKAFMISRFGNVEFGAVHFFKATRGFRKYWNFVNGKVEDLKWPKAIQQRMEMNAGFFPPENLLLDRFASKMLEDIKKLLNARLNQHTDGPAFINQWKNSLNHFKKNNIKIIDDL